MTKPKLSELRKGKRYFLDSDGDGNGKFVVPLVFIYRGLFERSEMDEVHPGHGVMHLFESQGNPGSGVWKGNRLGGVTNYSREREAEFDRKALRYLIKTSRGPDRKGFVKQLKARERRRNQ